MSGGGGLTLGQQDDACDDDDDDDEELGRREEVLHVAGQFDAQTVDGDDQHCRNTGTDTSSL